MYNGELEFGKRSIKQQIRYEKFLAVKGNFNKEQQKWRTSSDIDAMTDETKNLLQ